MSSSLPERFVRHPHRTLLGLTLPTLGALIAEPLTGLVDTYFVAQLGEGPEAALGVGVTILSSLIWIFNFLSIGCQTEVAHAQGAGDRERARRIASLALTLSILGGLFLLAALWPSAGSVATWMRAHGETHDDAVAYLRIRLLAAPFVLWTATAWGALRGLGDVRTPLYIALFVNALNVVLDAVWIQGWGPFPALGVQGAAWASSVSQVLGAVLTTLMFLRRLGWSRGFALREARALLVVGRDLFLRTGLLLTFLLIGTRAATGLGDIEGAAHQAVRQVWTFAAFLLDSIALAAQTMVGEFLGAGRGREARRAAKFSCSWGLAVGIALVALGLPSGQLLASHFVPESAHAAFMACWWIAVLFQPLNALSFVSDGVHWATRDYRYLRNVMLLATGAGLVLVLVLEAHGWLTLARLWFATGLWIAMRAGLGVARIVTTSKRAPLAAAARAAPGASTGGAEASAADE